MILSTQPDFQGVNTVGHALRSNFINSSLDLAREHPNPLIQRNIKYTEALCDHITSHLCGDTFHQTAQEKTNPVTHNFPFDPIFQPNNHEFYSTLPRMTPMLSRRKNNDHHRKKDFHPRAL